MSGVADEKNEASVFRAFLYTAETQGGIFDGIKTKGGHFPYVFGFLILMKRRVVFFREPASHK